MDWSQVLVASALALVALNGRDWPIVSVLAANFIATMILAGSPLFVAGADIACALILLRMGTIRAKAVGWFYVLMLISYAIGRACELPNSATYAIVDLIGLAQYMVAGHVDNGGRGVARGFADCGRVGLRLVRRASGAMGLYPGA